jgi:multidrug efflux pump
VSISSPFINRPVATTLLTAAIAIAGMLGYFALPVSPLPQVDFPTISVQAQLPGASPEVVATSLTAPLERHLGEIADVTEMTSQSQVGQTRITLQFGLDRNINGAAEDVQAAINAAQADLPTNLLSSPTYRKVNPADAPILILSLTSQTLTRGQMYDAASNVLQQRLSQVSGVGQVIIGGAAQPAVRVELDPLALSRYAIGLEDVRSALGNANANAPKGDVEVGERRWQIYTNDQANKAAEYRNLVIAYRNGDALRLKDVADVEDSVQDLRNIGLADAKPAVLVIIFRQPGANIITTVDSVRDAIPQLKAAMPSDIDIAFASDRSTTIRASLAETQRTLLIAAALVIVVVYLFLRNGRAALVSAVTVPISITGAFGAMYLLGFSLDNLSLMALTIATGFVVDDAIVVLENISRHLEDGMSRREAALRGAREIGFTVVSISVSLVAVFIPILLMGGIIGRLFREFAMTLSLAILVSMVIALTTTPMMCALFLRAGPKEIAGLHRRQSLFDRLQSGYARTLLIALDHRRTVLVSLVAVIALNAALIYEIPKSFFPEQDTGRITASLVADQSVSFQLMSQKLTQMMQIVKQDPAVEDVVGFSGAGSGGAAAQTNTGSVFISLKPLSERDGVDAVTARLRRKLAAVPGARLYMQPVQDIRIGGRQANAEYQYSLLGDRTDDVYAWSPKLLAALERDPTFTDLNSDQQQHGLETLVTFDRDTASRLGLTMYQVDNTLYDAFGQRSVSTIYSAINQYHVVMEVSPPFWQRPQSLTQLFVSAAGAPASGSQSAALSAVSAGAVAAVATPSVAAIAAVSAPLSSASASASNTSFTPINNVVSLTLPATQGSAASSAGASQASVEATGSSASSATSAAAAVRTAS